MTDTMRSAGVALGPVTAETYQEFRQAFAATFGFEARPADVDRSREWVDYERLLAARGSDGAIVGTAGALTFEMSLPAGRFAGCAGISVVSVRADHRRRGLLTRMMGRLLDDAAERGEPFAALWASESPIYGRFGFGPAVPTVEVSLDRRHAALGCEGPVEEIRLVDVEDARPAFAELHERFRRTRGGVLSRSPGWWTRMLTAEPSQAGDEGPLRLGLLPDRGYVIYSLEPRWVNGVPRGSVHIEDLVALDPEATAALWRFVVETDLAEKVEVVRRPPDDPVLAMLVDPARAKVTAGWPLYLRLVDLPAALTARGYLGDHAFDIEVADALRPENSGRWRLTVSDGEPSCERTDRAPGIVMDAAALATLVLGGVRATALHGAARIRCSYDDAVALDRLFAVDRAPVTEMMF